MKEMTLRKIVIENDDGTVSLDFEAIYG